MKLLFVDANRSMVEMVTGWLKVLGYDVYHAYSEEQTRFKWIEHKPDLVIIDNNLDNVDVLSLCSELKRKCDALLIIVDERKDVRDEVRCLEAGADDYLHKPFFPDQLIAHIHAITRRKHPVIQQNPPTRFVRVGPLCIDSLHNEVRIRDQILRLTPIEGKLMYFLAINAGIVCTPSQIVNYGWEFTSNGDASLVKSHIYHLRQKIEENPQNPRYILTIPNVGYMLARHTDSESETRLVKVGGEPSLLEYKS